MDSKNSKNAPQLTIPVIVTFVFFVIWMVCAVLFAIMSDLDYYDLAIWEKYDALLKFDYPPLFRSNFYYSFGPCLITATVAEVLFLVVCVLYQRESTDTILSNISGLACIGWSAILWIFVLVVGITHWLMTFGKADPYAFDLEKRQAVLELYAKKFEDQAGQKLHENSPGALDIISPEHYTWLSSVSADHSPWVFPVFFIYARCLPFLFLFLAQYYGIASYRRAYRASC